VKIDRFNDMNAPHVTFVKKIMLDGSLCPKCFEVSERLGKDGTLEMINYIAIADASDLESEGMKLASKYQVERAPFFIVELGDGSVEVFDIYFKFKRYMQKFPSILELKKIA
jgi:hypothetical protein